MPIHHCMSHNNSMSDRVMESVYVWNLDYSYPFVIRDERCTFDNYIIEAALGISVFTHAHLQCQFSYSSRHITVTTLILAVELMG